MARIIVEKRERKTKDGGSWMMSVVLVWSVRCLSAEVSALLTVSLQVWVLSIFLFWHLTLFPQCCFCPDFHNYITRTSQPCLSLLVLAVHNKILSKVRHKSQDMPTCTVHTLSDRAGSSHAEEGEEDDGWRSGGWKLDVEELMEWTNDKGDVKMRTLPGSHDQRSRTGSGTFLTSFQLIMSFIISHYFCASLLIAAHKHKTNLKLFFKSKIQFKTYR